MVLGKRELKQGKSLLLGDLNSHLLLICRNPSSDQLRLLSSFPSCMFTAATRAGFSSLPGAILSLSSLAYVSLVEQGVALVQVFIL